MESIEKLRELAADINGTEIIAHIDVVGKFAFHPEWLDSWHKAFDAACGEIEREVAERYMELPLDADGVPIRIGEVVTWLNGAPSNKFTIDTFAFDMDHGEWDVKSSNFLNIFPAHRCRHVKPRTVEDVLREFAQCFCTDKTNFDGSADGDTVAKYAAEIRELMEVDE